MADFYCACDKTHPIDEHYNKILIFSEGGSLALNYEFVQIDDTAS